MIFRLLQPVVLAQCLRDFTGIREEKKSDRVHLLETLSWLHRAQTVTQSGGVAAWYRFDKGWGYPFIETTGYIIQTYLTAASAFARSGFTDQAILMGDFICDMQLPSGGFRTYPPQQQVDSSPTVFNTGQDILGLMSLFKATGKKKYLNAAVRACDFLLEIQETNGSWVKFEFGEVARTYETRSAWALLSVWKSTGQKKYKEAAIRNLEWALEKQDSVTGWFSDAELPGPTPAHAYTHTISYCVEGMWFSGQILSDKRFIKSALLALDGAMSGIRSTHSIVFPGIFTTDWHSTASFECLTGTAQFAAMYCHAFLATKNPKYREAAEALITQLKSRQLTRGETHEIRGGVAGSYPIYGDIWRLQGYSRLSYPNWAAKFFADALLLHMIVTEEVSRDLLASFE